MEGAASGADDRLGELSSDPVASPARQDVEIPEAGDAVCVRVWVGHEAADPNELTVNEGTEQDFAALRKSIGPRLPLCEDASDETEALLLRRVEERVQLGLSELSETDDRSSHAVPNAA
jgi:hypothetical protein